MLITDPFVPILWVNEPLQVQVKISSCHRNTQTGGGFVAHLDQIFSLCLPSRKPLTATQSNVEIFSARLRY